MSFFARLASNVGKQGQGFLEDQQARQQTQQELERQARRDALQEMLTNARIQDLNKPERETPINWRDFTDEEGNLYQTNPQDASSRPVLGPDGKQLRGRTPREPRTTEEEVARLRALIDAGVRRDPNAPPRGGSGNPTPGQDRMNARNEAIGYARSMINTMDAPTAARVLREIWPQLGGEADKIVTDAFRWRDGNPNTGRSGPRIPVGVTPR